MDALGRDSPTPVCSVCDCVYGFMPFGLHLRVGIFYFYLGLSSRACCGGAGGGGRRGSSRAGMLCVTPAAPLVAIFIVLAVTRPCAEGLCCGGSGGP